MTTTRVNELPEVFRGADAVAAGALTQKALRGTAVRRVLRGVYSPKSAVPSHVLSCQASALIAPADAVISGASALTVHGVSLRRSGDPVHVVVPPGRRLTLGSGVRVSHRVVTAGEAMPWCGRRLATPLRAAFDLLLDQQPTDAVPDLDRVLRSGLVGGPSLGRLLAARSDRGIVLARESLQLSDPRAESPPESWVRVVLGMAGLLLVPQVSIFTERGEFVARVDLALEQERVAVEYEGGWHGEPGALVRDRDRLNRIREAGWVVVFVTAADRRRPVRELVAKVQGARAAQGRKLA